MPMYCYVCPKCEGKQQVVRPMSESSRRTFCLKCKTKMKRDFITEHSSTRGDWVDQLESNGAGVGADQVAEAREFAKVNKIPIEYKRDGTALFRSHSSRREALKKLGLMDKDAFC